MIGTLILAQWGMGEEYLGVIEVMMKLSMMK